MTDTEVAAVRQDLPAQGTWEIDPAHTTVGFVARHMVVSKVRGHFSDVSGTITVADPIEQSSVRVTVPTATVNTRDAKRDEHLRSADFFDVEQYPEITFVSTGVRRDGDHWVVEGDLTIRGVTRPVALETIYLGLLKNPWGQEVAMFSAKTEVDREEWGLTWNAPLETGGVLVGRRVVLEIEAQAVRQTD